MLGRCVTDGIVDQTGNHVHTSICGAPDDRSESVLAGSVKRASDEQEGRRDGTFEGALQSSENHQLGPVLRKANAEHDDAPDGYADTEEATDMELLNEVVSWSFGDEV